MDFMAYYQVVPGNQDVDFFAAASPEEAVSKAETEIKERVAKKNPGKEVVLLMVGKVKNFPLLTRAEIWPSLLS